MPVGPLWSRSESRQFRGMVLVMTWQRGPPLAQIAHPMRICCACVVKCVLHKCTCCSPSGGHSSCWRRNAAHLPCPRTPTPPTPGWPATSCCSPPSARAGGPPSPPRGCKQRQTPQGPKRQPRGTSARGTTAACAKHMRGQRQRAPRAQKSARFQPGQSLLPQPLWVCACRVFSACIPCQCLSFSSSAPSARSFPESSVILLRAGGRNDFVS